MRFGGGAIQLTEDRGAAGFRFGHIRTTASRIGEGIGRVWSGTDASKINLAELP